MSFAETFKQSLIAHILWPNLITTALIRFPFDLARSVGPGTLSLNDIIMPPHCALSSLVGGRSTRTDIPTIWWVLWSPRDAILILVYRRYPTLTLTLTRKQGSFQHCTLRQLNLHTRQCQKWPYNSRRQDESAREKPSTCFFSCDSCN